MLEDEIKFCIHPGKMILDPANSVLKPLDSLPLLLEASVTLSTERAY